MPRHVEAWMDGVQLSAVAPVLIQQIYEDPSTLELTEGERPGRYGQRLLTRKRQTLKVAIELVIRELFDLEARARYLDAIADWARGSVLELSNRPDRVLSVVCTAEPALGEVRNYAAVIRLEFTAYTVPYWEDKTPMSISMTGDDESATVYLPGTVETPVRLIVTPSAETLTAFSVTVGGATIALTGLSVAAEGHLIIDRDPLDNLSATYNGASQLSKRSAASADDLMAAPGNTSIAFTANTSCGVTVLWKGRWA